MISKFSGVKGNIPFVSVLIGHTNYSAHLPPCEMQAAGHFGKQHQPRGLKFLFLVLMIGLRTDTQKFSYVFVLGQFQFCCTACDGDHERFFSLLLFSFFCNLIALLPASLVWL